MAKNYRARYQQTYRHYERGTRDSYSRRPFSSRDNRGQSNYHCQQNNKSQQRQSANRQPSRHPDSPVPSRREEREAPQHNRNHSQYRKQRGNKVEKRYYGKRRGPNKKMQQKPRSTFLVLKL